MSNHSTDHKMLYTKREYPCGCKVEGSGDVPDYCDEHWLPPSLRDPLKVMERGRELLKCMESSKTRMQETFSSALLAARIAVQEGRSIDREEVSKLIMIIDELRSPVPLWQRDEQAARAEVERLTALNAELLKPINQDEGYEALKRENVELQSMLDANQRTFVNLHQENERLQAELRAIDQACKAMEPQAILTLENERLRAALEGIVYESAGVEDCIKRALAALRPQTSAVEELGEHYVDGIRHSPPKRDGGF